MKKIIIPVLILLVAACSKKGGDKKAELEKLKQQQTEIAQKISELEKVLASHDGDGTAASENAKPVQLQILSTTTFKHYVEVQGRVDGDDNVNISPEMPGAVTKINVHVGEQVSKGAVMAELDNKVLLQSIAELQNGLDYATTMFQKQDNLWKQKIGSEVQYLNAKNQKESLERKLNTLKEQVELTKIKSPISGTLDALDLKIGQAVVPGLIVARVVNLNNLKVKAEVGESYAGSIKTGNQVLIVFPDMQDSLVNKLSYAAKAINPTNRTFSVEAMLTGRNDYHPNMVAVLKINDYSSKEPVITVPVATVQKSEDGNTFVMITFNNKAHKQPIKAGSVYNGVAEVLSGLKVGDKLIVKGFQDLNEGDEIKF